MSCDNHPFVKSIANCEKCETPMCGMCANYTDKGVFCEYCASNLETESYVSKQAQKLTQMEPAQGYEETDLVEEARSRREGRGTHFFQIAVIGISVVIMGYQLLAYNARSNAVAEVDVNSAEYAVTGFVQCMSVFQQIGQLLANNSPTSDALRCERPGTANVVTTISGGTRVAHPSPDVFGYSEISVSSNEPQPRLVL